jgi:hypothetical protein
MREVKFNHISRAAIFTSLLFVSGTRASITWTLHSGHYLPSPLSRHSPSSSKLTISLDICHPSRSPPSSSTLATILDTHYLRRPYRDGPTRLHYPPSPSSRPRIQATPISSILALIPTLPYRSRCNSIMASTFSYARIDSDEENASSQLDHFNMTGLSNALDQPSAA